MTGLRAAARASAGVILSVGTVVVVEEPSGKGAVLLVLAMLLGGSMLVVGFAVLELLGWVVRGLGL